MNLPRFNQLLEKNYAQKLSLAELHDFDRLSGVQQMRLMVRFFGYCRESFLDNFTIPQLTRIYRMWLSSEWGYMPDTWTERQVAEALEGNVPCWLTEGNPFYPRKPTGRYRVPEDVLDEWVKNDPKGSR